MSQEPAIHITQPVTVDDELVSAMERLMRQLGGTARAPSRAQLDRILGDSCTSLFLARRADETIVGVLALVVYRVPSGVRALIEDVVVDEDARGTGTGEALVRAGLEHARECGAVGVNLTSHGSRESANRLYTRIGFERRDTNVYRYLLQGSGGTEERRSGGVAHAREPREP